MSALTPTKQITPLALGAVLNLLTQYRLTLVQAEKVLRAINIVEEQEDWIPDIDDMADRFFVAAKAHEASAPDAEEPPALITIGSDDQPNFRR
jgi:hypothetical protein